MRDRSTQPDRVSADESSSVRDVQPRTVRMDDVTWSAAEDAAQRHGLGSAAEYIRQATVARLAWDRAVDAAKAGADPRQLADPDIFVKVLAAVLKQQSG